MASQGGKTDRGEPIKRKPKLRPDPSHSVQHHYPGVFARSRGESEQDSLPRVKNGS